MQEVLETQSHRVGVWYLKGAGCTHFSWMIVCPIMFSSAPSNTMQLFSTNVARGTVHNGDVIYLHKVVIVGRGTSACLVSGRTPSQEDTPASSAAPSSNAMHPRWARLSKECRFKTPNRCTQYYKGR